MRFKFRLWMLYLLQGMHFIWILLLQTLVLQGVMCVVLHIWLFDHDNNHNILVQCNSVSNVFVIFIDDLCDAQQCLT